MMIILKHFQPQSPVNSTRINTLEPIVALLKIKLSLMWTADKSAREMQDAITPEREKTEPALINLKRHNRGHFILFYPYIKTYLQIRTNTRPGDIHRK